MKKKVVIQPRLLDAQLLDKNGVHCGKVDDLLLSGKVGKELEVKAILVGPKAWYSRRNTWLHSILRFLFHDNREIVVPWVDVMEIFPVIQLRKTDSQLKLNQIDRKLSGWFKKIPGG